MCWEVGLRQYVGCRTLNGDRGVEIDVYLGILSMILDGLPFKDEGRDMTRVIMHDWWRVIRW